MNDDPQKLHPLDGLHDLIAVHIAPSAPEFCPASKTEQKKQNTEDDEAPVAKERLTAPFNLGSGW